MLYKIFDRIFKKIVLIIFLITLKNYRIIANDCICLKLCCPCCFGNESEDEIRNNSNDEIEIEKFLEKYETDKKYKKDEKTTIKFSIQPNSENYIKAFKDIDGRLSLYFKKNTTKFGEKKSDDHWIFSYFYNKKKIKDILQIGDYCVTFDREKNSSYKIDLEEALLNNEDNEIKYYSDRVKKLKNNNDGNVKYHNDYSEYLDSDLYIFSTQDKKYIGGISFQPLSSKNSPLKINIAYWLNYNYRGLGIMSIVVPTICKYFFTRIKEIKGYQIFWCKENLKSANLAKKTCHFIRTGHEKEYKIEEKEYKKGKDGIFITKI